MRILGHVDRCDALRIEGWVFCPEAPQTQFSIQVLAGGQAIGEMHAAHHRADLEAAGFGTGHCAFMFNMPQGLPDSALRDLRLRVLGSDVFLLPPDAAAGGAGGFRSRFGGLWPDRTDWADVLGQHFRGGRIDDETSALIFRFVRDGFVVIPNAVPPRMVGAVSEQAERAWTRPPDGLMAETLEPDGIPRLVRPDNEVRQGRTRLLDLYASSDIVRRVTANAPGLKFLAALLGDTPKVVAQSMLPRALGTPLGKDSARPPVPGHPLEQVATWLALEDITPGSGELEYLAGSHHAPEYLFGGRQREIAGFEAEAEAFGQAIQRQAAELGHRRGTFLARAGDLFIRHADLACGDARVTRPRASRRGLETVFVRAGQEPGYRAEAAHAELRVPGCVFVSRFGAVV